MSVELVWSTPRGDDLIAYMARVSNPQHQHRLEIANLIRYCANNGHWSIFEMVNMCVEITTTRMISAQTLRHNSMRFQEFSQRYAKVQEYVPVKARRQDTKNRQNSIDDMPEEIIDWFYEEQERLFRETHAVYDQAIEYGIAKECARAVVQMNSKTVMYVNGTVRSWIHYLAARTHPSAQKEHRDIALAAQELFIQQFPVVGQAMGWRQP